MVISMNVRSLSQKTTTFITFTTTTATNANDANTTPENAKNAPSESITVDPAPVRRSTRHRKATFKAVGANTTVANAVGAAEAPTTPADVEDLLYNCGDEDYPPQAMIAKSTIANEDKPTYEKAMASSEGSQWRKGIDEELNRIRELGVWELVPKPKDIKIFTSKWALARKRNEHNEVVRHKARLVLRGYEQVAGRDYDETYAGVVRSETSRLLLSLAAKYDWEIDQMDAVSAFLNSE